MRHPGGAPHRGGAWPRLAFLRLEQGRRELPAPIPLLLSNNLQGNLFDGQRVAVIGYPAFDGKRNDIQVMKYIFGGIYNVKRLAPGGIIGLGEDEGTFKHDCSTLGGNSGSVVLDLETGQCVGLHYAGAYRRANYAVSAKVLVERLESICGPLLLAPSLMSPTPSPAPSKPTPPSSGFWPFW